MRYYTRESGVRNLEREIARICRKVVKESALAGPKAKPGKIVNVTAKNLDKYLGVQRFARRSRDVAASGTPIGIGVCPTLGRWTTNW